MIGMIIYDASHYQATTACQPQILYMKKNHILSSLRLLCVLFLAVASLQPDRYLIAATYYVSQATGSDSYTPAQATNIATPWLTIQNAANNVAAGDTVLICAGTYRETVTLPVSGTFNAPITFAGYSNQIAVVSGANQATNWVLESPNIYYAPMSLTLGVGNQVFQNSQMMPEARWPNAGPEFPWQNSQTNPSPDWAYVTTANSANGWFTCTNLPARTNNYWVGGATLHIMAGYGNIMDVVAITSYTNSSQTLVTTYTQTAPAYAISTNNEFYLSGLKGELDSPGEWWYDSVNVRLYFYSTTTPVNVEAKVRGVGFNLSGRAFVQVTNLSFFGCTIQTDTGATNHLYAGLKMKYLMHSQTAFTSFPPNNDLLALESGTVLRNSDIGFSSSALVYLAGNNIRVINNNLHDAGYIPDWNPLLSCNQSNQQNLISYNTIHDSGRALLSYLSRATIVEYNDFTNGMRMTSDGAPVYDVNDSSPVLFDHNLVHDSPGPVGHTGFGVCGVYLDSKDSNWTVHHNVIYNIPTYCMVFNTLFTYQMVFNNTCANCGTGVYSFGPQTRDAGTAMYNNIFTGGFNGSSWYTSDLRYNLTANPGFVTNSYQLQSNSIAINQGVVIPGVTDGYIGPAPDLGALEVGANNWTTQVGYNVTPPSPDPVYNYPNFVFANQVADGGFESGTLTNYWTVASGSNAKINSASAWTNITSRTGFYSLSLGTGTSQVGQTLTNLAPNSRYMLYVGVYTTNTTATVTLGVTNYGNPAQVITIPATNAWSLYDLVFITGTNSTSASIYLNAVCSGIAPVYVDDFGVILKPEPNQALQNPLAYYKLDETNGLTAYDSSGYGQNATLSNSPAATWTNGVLNGALHFNGSNVLLTPSMTTPTNGLTVACWARSTGTSNAWNAYGCLISQRPSFVLHPILGTTQIKFVICTTTNTVNNIYWFPPSNFDVTQWHHYVGVYDAVYQTGSLYVDGVQAATAPVTAPILPTTGQVYIGKDDYTGDNLRNFLGSMDDVRIYNYTLPLAQIQALASLTNKNQVLHLALDDPPGSTNAWDSTGLGGNGILVNLNAATAWTNGILNGALSFNGVNSAVVTPSIATPSSLTVSCWAKSATSNWNASGCLVCERPAFALSPVMGTRNLQFLLYTNTSSHVTVAWTAPTGFDITQWHNYAGEFSPSSQTATLYVDGYAVATAAAAAVNPNSGPIYVGQDSAGGANANFQGVIDDVQLFAQALTWNQMLDVAYLTGKTPYFNLTPATPVNFSATAGGSSTITLVWNAGDSTQKGYELDYRLTGTTNWINLAYPAASATSYINMGLQANTSYDYRLEATNFYGASGFVMASAATPPAAPTGLSLTATNNQVTLFWTASSGATGYNVEGSTNNGGPYNVIGANVTSLSFTNTGLINGTPYFYVVSALNANGEGDSCAQVSGTPGALSRFGWVASASTRNFSFQPTNAIDGYISTRWGSETDQTNGMWFQVDMGAPQWFYQIVLENCVYPGDYPRGYQVNVSNDATNWGSPVATGVGSPSVTVIDFPPQSARYIRITETTNYSGGWWSIFEFNVYASLPSPWQNQDIGSVNLPGSASYASNTFTVQGAGADIHGPADAFQYVFQSSSADCSIMAQVASVQNVSVYSKAGVMIRETTATGAINVAMLVTPSEGIQFQWRTNTSNTTYNTSTSTTLTAPYWVKLTRTGNNFAGYYSPDGTTFTQLGSTQTFPMASSAMIGLAVTSHNTNQLCTATYTNVTAAP